MKDWKNCIADVVKLLTKHFTKGRGGYKIDKIVVHYNAGNLTVEGCWSVWQTRKASAHYQVEDDGRIGQLVWDRDMAWHCSNGVQNKRSIGIEHANRPDGTITEACLDNGAHLVAALCHLYGLGRPEWLVNVFPHKYFKGTLCPGQIYGSQKDAYIKRAQKWYDEMAGGGSQPAPKPEPGFSSYTVKVTDPPLNIRKGPGTNTEIVGRITEPGVFTIVGEGTGPGSSLWGKLKSGAGWIALDLTSKGSTAPKKKAVEELAREVIAGKWGNNPERKRRLQEAGYDSAAVQAAVNRMMG